MYAIRSYYVAEVRHLFSKYNGSMGESGSVAWMFDRKGIITLPIQDKTEDEILDIVLEAGAEDLQTEEDYFEVQTSLESLEPVRKALVAADLQIENASLQWIAKNTVNVNGDDADKVMKIIEAMEDRITSYNVCYTKLLRMRMWDFIFQKD